MDKTHRWTTAFNKYPVRAIGLTYDADFTAQYEWVEEEGSAFWDVVQIDALVVRCHNGEDVYDCFKRTTKRAIDDQCILVAQKLCPSPPEGYDTQGR
jgi:hypothetical protein